jgi:transposase-like protein
VAVRSGERDVMTAKIINLVRCPRCKNPAEIHEKNAWINHFGREPDEYEDVYRCRTCTTPFCGIDGETDAPFQFLFNGEEVI